MPGKPKATTSISKSSNIIVKNRQEKQQIDKKAKETSDKDLDTIKKKLKETDSKMKTISEGNGNSSSGSSELGIVAQSEVFTVRTQEHGRPKAKLFGGTMMSPAHSLMDITGSISVTSITSSISRFRADFDEFKCKMQIFGESLNLCKCIAGDFKNKMKWMEKRLNNLEKRHNLTKRESNYSTIINKNKKLSQKCLNYARILAKEHRFLPRMIREAIEIKKHPNFNREDGWKVPPAWDPVLHLTQPKKKHNTARQPDTLSSFCVDRTT